MFNNNSAIVSVLLFAYLLIAPCVALSFNDDRAAGILATIGIAAIILTRLDDLVSFSALGIKAKLRRKVAEVDKIIDQLKMVSKALATAGLQQIAMSGQLLSGLNTETKFKVRNDIVAALKKIGVSNSDIVEAHDVWIEVYGQLLLNIIVGDAAKDLDLAEIKDQIRKLPKLKNSQLPTGMELQGWAAGKSDSTVELCDQYRSLVDTGGMTKPDLIPFNSALGRQWLSSEG